MEKEKFEVLKKEVMKKSQNGMSFGFLEYVANNGWKMDKDELIEIIKELDYNISLSVSIDKYNNIIEKTLGSIEDNIDSE